MDQCWLRGVHGGAGRMSAEWTEDSNAHPAFSISIRPSQNAADRTPRVLVTFDLIFISARLLFSTVTSTLVVTGHLPAFSVPLVFTFPFCTRFPAYVVF